MKNIILLLLFGYSISGFSQISVDFCWPGSDISFETTFEHNFVQIDTNEIWYIAKPNKEILFIPSNSPYLGE